ncbi:MAG: choice-of-anchor J domain-containing protein [Muribaculaceae bacterium]|nr:choice-of-anchor J domain-containing protein [Muribaculaceae bacterium]
MKHKLLIALTALVALLPSAASAAPPVAKKLQAQSAKPAFERMTTARPADGAAYHAATTRRARSSQAPSLRKAMEAMHVAGTKLAAPAMNAGASFPELHGLVIYSDNWQHGEEQGLYQIASDGSLLKEISLSADPSPYSGVAVGGIYYCLTVNELNNGEEYYIDAYNIETGAYLGSSNSYSGYKYRVLDYAVDPTTGIVYGIGYNDNGNGFMLARHQFSIEQNKVSDVVTPVATMQGNWNSIAFDSHGQLYGISYTWDNGAVTSSTLCKIDKNTGSITTIGNTGQYPQYISSATIDTATDRMYWTVSTSTGEGYLCEVYLSTGAAIRIANLEGNAEVTGMFIGATPTKGTVPAAVENLVADFQPGSLTGTISFTAPTTLYNGTEASGPLSYSICDGNDEVATGQTSYGAQVSREITLSSPRTHTFKVTVSNSEGQSPVAIAYATGGGIIPPYTFDFGDQSCCDSFTIIGDCWDFKYSFARLEEKNGHDDWLITPLIWLEGGKVYKLSFLYYDRYDRWPGSLSVYLGSSATASWEQEVKLNKKDGTAIGYIEPITNGFYHVKIRGRLDYSKNNWWGIDIWNLSIEKGYIRKAPSPATELTVTPNSAGLCEAFIVFRTPAVDNDGWNLTKNLTKVEVCRNGTVVKTFTDVTPGVQLSYTDVTPGAGNFTYDIVAFNEYGESDPATAIAHIGIEKPAAPTNVNITETANPGEILLTWNAVTKDCNGNPLDSSRVRYLVCKYDNGWVPVHEDPISTTSYTYQAVPAGEQDIVRMAVFATTSGGENGTASEAIIVGSPYPYLAESFPNGSVSYLFLTGFYNGDDVNWLLYDDSLGVSAQDGDNGFIGMSGNYAEEYSSLYTGKINLAGMSNPRVMFYTYNIDGEEGEADLNTVRVYAKKASDETWTPITDALCISNLGEAGTWVPVTASLAGFAGEIVQVRIEATIKNYAYTLFDNIRVDDFYIHDLECSAITAPSKVRVGNNYSVAVKVANRGLEPESAFTIKLYADNKEVASRQVASLGVDMNVRETFALTMDASATKDVKLHAEVVYSADENAANNKSQTVAVSPQQHYSLPAVTDLAATKTDDGVKLGWSEPAYHNVSAGAETIDFENGAAWAHDYEGWVFTDGDGSPVGGFQGSDIPGIIPGTTTASFFVFDGADASVLGQHAASFEARSGNKYLAALFRSDDGQTDDWAISPALDGSAQTISFFARSYSTQYPEKIEVYYSRGGTDRSDFVKVNGVGGVVPGEWTEYTFSVPAGATRFAVRSCATGSFMLMLDDFTFATAADLSLVGYDVYRDGNKLTNSPVSDTQYLDSEATDGAHSYAVYTVYDEGTSASSNNATVYIAGVYDLGCTAIAAPARVRVGNSYNVAVNVANLGNRPASAFTIKLYADNAEVAAKQVASLGADMSVREVFALTMGASATEAVKYHAEVIYPGDENPGNNKSATVTVTPQQHFALPAVSDLTGKNETEGVELRWNEPDFNNVSAGAETVDFENGAAWSHDYADWVFTDGDGNPVGGIQDCDIPGINPGTTTASFFVFDATDNQSDAYVEAHTGYRCLAALCRYDKGQVDDWAISPALDGSAQTISFFAKSYSNQFRERIEVYYSRGGTDRTDFVKVNGVGGTVPADWTEYTFSVPDGATHFAVRSFATGGCMLMLDDFTFSAAAEVNFVGYEVYRDGEKITYGPILLTEYLDSEAVDGSHSYVVYAVYDQGMSAPSNTITIIAAGIFDVEVDPDMDIEYYTPQGIRVLTPEKGGLYIVRQGNVVKKVAVK